jgi:hypothetical protein
LVMDLVMNGLSRAVLADSFVCHVGQAEQDADCSPPGYQALASSSPAVGRLCRAIALVGIGERLDLFGRGEAVKVGDDAKQVLACPWKRSRR